MSSAAEFIGFCARTRPWNTLARWLIVASVACLPWTALHDLRGFSFALEISPLLSILLRTVFTAAWIGLAFPAIILQPLHERVLTIRNVGLQVTTEYGIPFSTHNDQRRIGLCVADEVQYEMNAASTTDVISITEGDDDDYNDDNCIAAAASSNCNTQNRTSGKNRSCGACKCHCIVLRTDKRFIPQRDIDGIIINEGFSGFRVVYYLAVVVHREPRLIVLFGSLALTLKELTRAWRRIRVALYGRDALILANESATMELLSKQCQ